MKSEDIVVTFRGFHPSEIEKFELQEFIDRLQLFAPKESFIKVHFSRFEDCYQGMVRIYSNQLPFSSISDSSSLSETVALLEKKLQNQQAILLAKTASQLPEDHPATEFPA